MKYAIDINLEVSDPGTLDDIVTALSGVLPYMADNVTVRPRRTDRHDPNGPLLDEQRRTLFALYRAVFGESNDRQRHAFTRQIVGRDAVSWSAAGLGRLTYDEASKVIDALKALNV